MDPVSMATLLKKLFKHLLKQSSPKKQDMNLKERWQSKTPDFWKKVQKIGIAFGVIGGAIIAAPVALPAALITAGGYMIAVGSVTATLSQLTKEDAAK